MNKITISLLAAVVLAFAPAADTQSLQTYFKFGPQDFRFTVGTNGCLYAYCMTVPAPGTQLKITSLGTDAKLLAGTIRSVTLLGCTEKLVWSQQADGLVIARPEQMPFQTAVCFKIALSQSIDSLAVKGDGHHQIN